MNDTFSESDKPWEGPEAWKLKDSYAPGEVKAKRDPKVSSYLYDTSGTGIKPSASPTELEKTPDIKVKDRDALKLISLVSDGQKAFTDEKELFQFSSSRCIWLKISSH